MVLNRLERRTARFVEQDFGSDSQACRASSRAKSQIGKAHSIRVGMSIDPLASGSSIVTGSLVETGNPFECVALTGNL